MAETATVLPGGLAKWLKQQPGSMAMA